MAELPDPDRLLANATNFLIQGNEFYEASLLLLSEITIGYTNDDFSTGTELDIGIVAARSIFDIVIDRQNPSAQKLIQAFNSVLPGDFYIKRFSARVEFTEYSANWREAMLEMIEGKRPLNQGIPFQEKPRFSWETLFFRSPVEVTIAKSLDRTGVLFLPNCMARLGQTGNREGREADFLICCDGKWGILEINGETFHTSAAKDHDRGRLFKIHGIKVFEPYDAKRCIKEPDSVVREFLIMLKRNG